MARGTRINFAASRLNWERENTTFDGPWIQEVSREELLSAFDDWEPEVSALLQVNLVTIIGQAILRTFPVTVHPIAE